MASIPFAFYAGTLDIAENTLAVVFVIALLAASVALFSSSFRNNENQDLPRTQSSRKIVIIGTPVGAVLGSLAGIVGIGGGIWLSPLLILSRLVNPKQAAATASFFILTNSISGFSAHAITKTVDWEFLVPLLVVVIIGGFLGSRFGSFRIKQNVLRQIVGGIVAIAALNIVLKSWFL